MQRWISHTKVEKFDGEVTLEQREAGLTLPYEVDERHGNLLVIGGASALFSRLIAVTVTAFDNTNARIGVGNSTTAVVDTQTDLQAIAGAANRQGNVMEATYPQHTDTTGTAGSKSIIFRSSFATTEANFLWNEWGVFNGAPGTGRMLNRKVENLGTKTSAATWVLTLTLSLA